MDRSKLATRPDALRGAAVLEPREFELFRALVSARCGVRLADTKRLLLQNRLGKRLRALGLASYAAYYRHLTSRAGEATELGHFLSAVTTHETHFFREPQHLAALEQELLPAHASLAQRERPLRVWSAGCSTGQEPYTLALVITHWLARRSGFGFEVHAGDIDQDALAVGRAAAYPLAAKDEIPLPYQRYLEIGASSFRIAEALRARVAFRFQNFAVLGAAEPRYDVVFCRNAMMYLEPGVRARLVRVLWASLLPGGTLVIGAAETLHGMPRLFAPYHVGRATLHRRLEARDEQG